MKNFKKKIALLCVLTLVLSCIGPVSPAFAAESWESGFYKSAGKVTSSNGIVTVGNGSSTAASSYEKRSAGLTTNFTATTRMRVTSYGTADSNNRGVYFSNGSRGTGLYLAENYVRPFATSPSNVSFAVGTDWHIYKFQVEGNMHNIYIDGKLVVTGTTRTHNYNMMQFFNSGNGALEVDYLEIETNTAGLDKRLTRLYATQDSTYTPEFTVDWSDPSTYADWTITDTEDITIDKTNGILNINTAKQGSRLAAGETFYHQVERAPLTPENFDVEFDLQMVRAETGAFQIRILSEGTDHYYYIRQDRVGHSDGDAPQTGGQLNIGNDWHHWKFEVRGNKHTLFFDGRAVHTCNTKVANNSAVIRFILSTTYGDYNVNLGKIHYKPYFPEVELLTPANNSSYVEGEDIVFKATPETDVEYVDYYVDGVKVGQGYAPDYNYVFNTSKVGTFEVSAGVGGSISKVKNKITVQKGFNAELSLSKIVVQLGKTVTASIGYDYQSTATKPTKVEYFVDGNKVAESTTAPFSVELGNWKIGTSLVEARIYNGNGAMASSAKSVKVYDSKASSGNLTREYEVDYSYSSGSGLINISDGYYKLDMKHGTSAITYQTNEGTETYALGAGKYKVAVISGIAEVYFNGHYAFSFFMPKATENNIAYSGISSFKITGNGTKVRYLSKESNSGNFDVSGINMPYYFNVEFDKKDTSDETIVVYDGEHKIALEFKGGKINTVNFKTETAKAEPFVLSGDAKAGYYKIVCSRGLCQLYIDNRYVDSFKSVPQAGITRVKRTMTNPSSSTILEIKGIDDIYYHNDDFSGNTELNSLDYWIPEESTISASIESGQMKINGTGTYLLNAQTYNTVTKWRAKVTSGDEFYIATRLFSERHHVKAGYNFTTKRWYTHEYFDMVEFPHISGVDIYDKSMEFTSPNLVLDAWHDFELNTDGNNLVLKMDGAVVIETDELQSPYSGYIGFGVKNGTVLIDEFSYTGECGAFAGIRSRIVNGPDDFKVSDFVKLSDGTVVGHYYGRQYRTTNEGQSWIREVSPLSIRSIGHTLRDGTQLKFEIEDGKAWCYASTDDCATWEKRGSMDFDFDNICFLNGSLEEGSDGTIYVGNDAGHSEFYGQPRILYSNDKGWTWHESEIMFGNVETGEHDSTHTHYTGWNAQELTFEELPDGKTVRCFARTANGFVYYMDSTDSGKTWGEFRPTELLNPLVTFNVEQDVNDPNVYYAVTMHSANTESYHDIDRSRSRIALLVSRDGMKTWEFVATLNESVGWNNYAKANSATKAYGNTLYIADNSNYEENFSIVYALDPTKLKSKKRLESVHQTKVQHPQENAGFMQFRDRFDEMSFLPTTSNGATIFGNNVNITVHDGMYDAETIGRVFGATVVEDGTTVTFEIGEGTVIFTEGSADYVVNGKTKTYSSACMKNGYFSIEACAEAFGRQLDKIDGIYAIDLSNK